MEVLNLIHFSSCNIVSMNLVIDCKHVFFSYFSKQEMRWQLAENAILHFESSSEQLSQDWHSCTWLGLGGERRSRKEKQNEERARTQQNVQLCTSAFSISTKCKKCKLLNVTERDAHSCATQATLFTLAWTDFCLFSSIQRLSTRPESGERNVHVIAAAEGETAIFLI